MHRHARIPVVVLAIAFAIAGCRGDKQASDAQAQDANLPAPEAGKGAVTGMPDSPGPGAIGTPAPPAPSTLADAEAGDAVLSPDAQGTDTGDAGAPTPPDAPVAPANGDPVAEDASQVVRDYYAAIDARDYGRAYRLWSDGGRASRQSARQFADGFADTSNVSVELGTPGDEDAGAGQRYIEIPVTVTAIHADGSRHRYAGSYVLHRTVVDGASAEQRAWRIDRATLREATP